MAERNDILHIAYITTAERRDITRAFVTPDEAAAFVAAEDTGSDGEVRERTIGKTVSRYRIGYTMIGGGNDRLIDDATLAEIADAYNTAMEQREANERAAGW